MKNGVLKLIGGLFITAVFYFFSTKISNETWHRLFICFIYLFLGVSIKGLYCIVKKNKDPEKEKKYNWIADFIFNSWAALAVGSFIYLISYDNFQKTEFAFFRFISIFIFSYSGFIVDEIKTSLLG